jgi:hypothetical protein
MNVVARLTVCSRPAVLLPIVPTYCMVRGSEMGWEESLLDIPSLPGKVSGIGELAYGKGSPSGYGAAAAEGGSEELAGICADCSKDRGSLGLRGLILMGEKLMGGSHICSRVFFSSKSMTASSLGRRSPLDLAQLCHS